MAVPALFRAGFSVSEVGAIDAVLVAELARGERHLPATDTPGIDMDKVRAVVVTDTSALHGDCSVAESA